MSERISSLLNAAKAATVHLLKAGEMEANKRSFVDKAIKALVGGLVSLVDTPLDPGDNRDAGRNIGGQMIDSLRKQLRSEAPDAAVDELEEVGRRNLTKSSAADLSAEGFALWRALELADSHGKRLRNIAAVLYSSTEVQEAAEAYLEGSKNPDTGRRWSFNALANVAEQQDEDPEDEQQEQDEDPEDEQQEQEQEQDEDPEDEQQEQDEDPEDEGPEQIETLEGFADEIRAILLRTDPKVLNSLYESAGRRQIRTVLREIHAGDFDA